MRTFYEKPKISVQVFGKLYFCNHLVYSRCTLYQIKDKGFAVIQQRYSEKDKTTYWCELESCYANDIYLQSGFKEYFDRVADKPNEDGIYPTRTLRQVMHALKMKPIRTEVWETAFTRENI